MIENRRQDGKTLGGGLAKREWSGRQPPSAPRSMREAFQRSTSSLTRHSSFSRGQPRFQPATGRKLDQHRGTASLGPRIGYRSQLPQAYLLFGATAQTWAPARNAGDEGGLSADARKRQHSSSRGSQGGSTSSQLPASKRLHIDEQDQRVGGPVRGLDVKEKDRVELEPEDEEEKDKVIFKKEPED
jgi:hypothetical protein